MDIKTIIISTAAAVVASAVTAPLAVSFVTLQASTPGTAETGHSNITGNSIAGRFGAGTTPTVARVQVNETGPLIGVRTVTSTGDAINALANSTTGASTTGRFVNSSASGKAILGENISTSGNTYGGDFKARSVDGGAALLGRHIATTGAGIGVNGTSASPNGNAGVFLNTNLNSGAKIGGPGGSILTSGTLPRHQYSNSSTAAMVPVAYGYVSSNGSIFAGTNNFTVTNPSTGVYDINVNGTVGSPIIFATAFQNTGNEFCSIGSQASGEFRVNVWNVTSNALNSSDFYFVVYSPNGITAGPTTPDWYEQPSQLKRFGDMESWQKADARSFAQWLDDRRKWDKTHEDSSNRPQ